MKRNDITVKQLCVTKKAQRRMNGDYMLENKVINGSLKITCSNHVTGEGILLTNCVWEKRIFIDINTCLVQYDFPWVIPSSSDVIQLL